MKYSLRSLMAVPNRRLLLMTTKRRSWEFGKQESDKAREVRAMRARGAEMVSSGWRANAFASASRAILCIVSAFGTHATEELRASDPKPIAEMKGVPTRCIAFSPGGD